jgi:hypothetical protein
MLVSEVPPVCKPAAKLLAPPPPFLGKVHVEFPATAAEPRFLVVATVPVVVIVV